MRALFNHSGKNLYLNREYEDLRREYEDLRRPFALSADVPYTDVWDFPTVQFYKGKHPCEKPLALMEHIITVSSRPGNVVLDPFCGSGVTGIAARKHNRKFIGIERDPSWVETACRRIGAANACTGLYSDRAESMSREHETAVAVLTIARQRLAHHSRQGRLF